MNEERRQKSPAEWTEEEYLEHKARAKREYLVPEGGFDAVIESRCYEASLDDRRTGFAAG